MASLEISSPSGDTPDPGLSLKRLCDSLHIAYNLRPEKYDQWAEGSSFYAYSDAMNIFLDERDAPHERTHREDLCLKASGLMIVTYWMDIHPGKGVPTRGFVEWLFQQSEYDEQAVVTPLTHACADDLSIPMLADQRTQMQGAQTLGELEPLLDEVNPHHRAVSDEYVYPRTSPITRDHIASVLQPTLTDLVGALEQEGHQPYDLDYLCRVNDQLNDRRL